MSQICRWRGVNAIGHIVHVQQVDLLKDVVGVVEWPSCCGETGELFNEATVLPE